jgi:intein/homing endonuclease
MKDYLAYTAGLIDGEGSITLLRSRASDKFRHPVVSLTSTSRELIDFLVESFGGTVKTQKVYQSHHKNSWMWMIQWNSAINFLSAIRPFMKESSKCKRADLLLTSYKDNTNRNGKYTQEEIEKKLDFEKAFLSS